MFTVKELREQAKSYGLRGYSTLRKPGLIRLIAEARAPVFRERLKRALKTWRYPALRGDIDNPHKKAQRIRELYQFKDEVTAQKYEQESKSNPLKRLKMHNRAYKRVMRHGYRKEPLSRAIVQERPKLLEEIIPKDSEEKGRRIGHEPIGHTWKLLRGLAGSVVDSIMTKVEALQTSNV